tara:strand:- start:3474 stop:4733 length:1260 start_codon:yes stop_codon:yes gene_type:complete
MNKVEKYVYNILKSKPWLKFIIRNLYQSLFDLLPRNKEFSVSPIDYKEGYFFGFHDKTPFSFDNSKVLANGFDIPLRMPFDDEALAIGYFNFSDGKLGDFVKVSNSIAWNYHKGCRLQWLNKSSLIFNSVIEDNLISKIVNINSKEETIINYPIDTVSEDGCWATSYSYERLHKLMPGYGYNYKDEGFLEENNSKKTGLFLVDLINNKKELLVSLFDLSNDISLDTSVQNYRHYVTHSEFSYDDRYISFLHRWTLDDIRDRTTRLVIYDLHDKNYFILPTDGMVSHYVWNEKNQIIAYCTVEGIDSHVLFSIPNIKDYQKIDSNILNSDGHQSFITSSTFITDMYPDRYRNSKIFKVNIESNDVELLASVYSPKKYQTRDFKNHIACDLHPRVAPNGKYISFDSVKSGKRSLCVMELPT